MDSYNQTDKSTAWYKFGRIYGGVFVSEEIDSGGMLKMDMQRWLASKECLSINFLHCWLPFAQRAQAHPFHMHIIDYPLCPSET